MTDITQHGTHRLEHDGKVWTVDAKYFAGAKEFRVYKVYGDITDLGGLKLAIEAFLEPHLDRCTVLLKL